MAKKRLLTWHKPSRRWKKQIAGTVHYFGYGRAEDDLRSYREAEARYLDLAAKRARNEPIEIPLGRATLDDICEKYLQQVEARHARQKIAGADDKPAGARIRREVSATHLDKVRMALNAFIDFAGAGTPFSRVRELLLEDYRNHVLELPMSAKTGKRISPHTAKTRLLVVKELMTWAYEMRLCELPRNLRRYAQVSLPAPAPKTFTIEEIHQLWAAATTRLRILIALALNCGYGQQDIADLRIEEVDLNNGCIDRERSKTAIRARHKLWPVTLQLLRDHIEKHKIATGLVFQTCRGHALVENKWEDGKLHRSDAVSCAFRRLMEKAGLDGGRGFYTLRKTGASEIEKINQLVTEIYLAHAERGMKRNYAERNWAALDAALLELDSRLALSVEPRDSGIVTSLVLSSLSPNVEPSRPASISDPPLASLDVSLPKAG